MASTTVVAVRHLPIGGCRTAVVACVALIVTLAGCGMGDEPRSGPGSAPPGGAEGDAVGLSETPEEGHEGVAGTEAEHSGASDQPNEVAPEPTAIPVRELPWSDVEQVGPRTLHVHFVLGAPPCSLLARVDVTESDATVEIRLVEGRQRGADCDGPVPAIGAPRFTTVHLGDPLGDREIIDAAQG